MITTSVTTWVGSKVVYNDSVQLATNLFLVVPKEYKYNQSEVPLQDSPTYI